MLQWPAGTVGGGRAEGAGVQSRRLQLQGHILQGLHCVHRDGRQRSHGAVGAAAPAMLTMPRPRGTIGAPCPQRRELRSLLAAAVLFALLSLTGCELPLDEGDDSGQGPGDESGDDGVSPLANYVGCFVNMRPNRIGGHELQFHTYVPRNGQSCHRPHSLSVGLSFRVAQTSCATLSNSSGLTGCRDTILEPFHSYGNL